MVDDTPSLPSRDPVEDREALRHSLERAREDLEVSQEQLRRLMTAQEAVREGERRRIARELHDELQQALVGIRLELSGTMALLPDNPSKARERLEAVDAMVGSALQSTRRLVNDLRPRLLDDLGLVAALESLAAQFRQRGGVPCVFRVDEGLDELALPPEVATCLYRVAQEGLQNVARHARAGRVTLTLALAPGARLAMSLADDGCGIGPADRARVDAFGLLGMRERVQGLGGEWRLTSRPGAGTRIDAVVPVRLASRPAGPAR